MESIYKLYGSFWDGKPLPDKPPRIDFMYETNLNYPMLLSEIMKQENVTVSENENSLILIDYIPDSRSKCIQDFYTVRLLQIIRCFNALVVCNNKKKAEQLEKMVRNYYKKETSSRLLAQSDDVSRLI